MLNATRARIEKALKQHQQQVADVLTKQSVKAHIVGDLKAYKKLAPISIDFGSVQKGAKEFGVKYGALLKNEGATMIKGKKVFWLAESMKETRGNVANIINEGVRTGKGMDAIARELRGTLIRDKNFEYKRIARTETGNIQAHAADKRYKEEGVEEVDWLCGQKPCPLCAPYCGKRYKINEAPALLVHPNGTCDKAPVVTRRVREKIDKKSIEPPKKEIVPKKKVTKHKKKEAVKGITKEKIKEERATADELWKKTKNDGNEHAKITDINGKTTYADGNKHSVNYLSPDEKHSAHHTHPNWDSPLSGADLAGFLRNRYTITDSASTSKTIYMAIKRADTIKPTRSFEALTKQIDSVSDRIFDKAQSKLYAKTGKKLTKKQHFELLNKSMNEGNEIIAKEYKFDLASFGR